jgi:2-polyprenyl-3-methyl-5-hydroxy-6-metoxy-1,4-benzoquinol methylase
MKIRSCPNEHDFICDLFSFKGVKYSKEICKNCGFTVTLPISTNRENIYDSGHYTVKGFRIIPFIINLPDYLFFHLIFLLKGVKRSINILDFGCGKGFFLYLLKKLGYKNLSGVETSIPRADFSKNLTGLDISHDYYNGGKIMDRKYNLVTMIHVLEHIPEPFLFLDKLLDGCIEDGGSIFIEVPNINSLSSIIAKESWAHFTPHFHTNHFTLLSLKQFCFERNLRFSTIGTFSFYNSAMGMTSALLSFFGYKGSIFEDLKMKKLIILFSFIIFLPLSVLLELLLALFTNKGSVIKFIIYNK